MKRPIPLIWAVLAGSAAFAASTVALALGTAQLSSWSPPATLPPLRPAPALTAQPPVASSFTSFTVSFSTSAGDVHGIIASPIAGTDVGIVLVAGSGPADHNTLRPLAERFAQAGIAAITYDKRTDGYDLFHRDFSQLADDASHAANALREATGVTRVGAWGISEGGWVASLASGHADDPLDFVVLASAPVVTPLEQLSWTADNALSGSPVFIRRATATALSGGRALFTYLDSDAQDALSNGAAPVFALWGGDDNTVPVNEAYRRLAAIVDGDRLTAHIIPSAGHDLLARTDVWFPSVIAWVTDPDGGSLTGAEPASALGVTPPPPAAWFTDPRIHLATSVVVAVAAGVYVQRRSHPMKEGRSRG